MPTYDYVCRACEHRFEHFQSMQEARLRKCPECGKLRLERLIGAGAGILFKGSGFYETDYKRKAPPPSGAPQGSDGGASADGAKGGSGPKTDGGSKRDGDSKTDGGTKGDGSKTEGGSTGTGGAKAEGRSPGRKASPPPKDA
jgi:putative FmdB family regulatory protein